jgi:chemotaxis protein methyltransferase CheR
VNKPAAHASVRQQEFVFEQSDFEHLRELIKQTTGINLADSKKQLVYGRISRRLRHLGLASFGAYRRLLETGGGSELSEFCNAMTTNLTAFFRESHHFDYLRDKILKPLRDDPRGSRRLRIWSAACSSGEEPYCIAMTVCEAIPEWRKWDIKILATDVDSAMVEFARRGIYGADRIKGLSERRLREFFGSEGGAASATYTVTPQLAQLITFKQLNLMHALPMRGPLDAIFCRNVIIYFDKETQRELFERVAPLQRAADHLFLGHSESLFKVSQRYELIGRTIYRRV